MSTSQPTSSTQTQEASPARKPARPAWVKLLGVLARVAVAAAGIGYIVYITHWHDYTPDGESQVRKGMLTLLQQASWWKLAAGLLVLGLVWPMQTTRWWWLLRSQGLRVGWMRTFRLTMVGLFFNFCVPVGSTGGDVLKAYYAAAGSSNKLGAVLSIVADRITGMLGLVVLAAVVGLLRLDDPVVQRIVMVAWVALGAFVVGITLYVSPGWRRRLGINTIARIKGLRQLDHVLLCYGKQPAVLAKTVGISAVSHLCLAASAALAGYALGMSADPLRVLTALPLAFAAATIPLTYQGLGVMEAVALGLIGGEAANVNPIVGMLILYRLFMLMYALGGAAGLLGGSIRLQPTPQGSTPSPESGKHAGDLADTSP